MFCSEYLDQGNRLSGNAYTAINAYFRNMVGQSLQLRTKNRFKLAWQINYKMIRRNTAAPFMNRSAEAPRNSND